MNEVQVRTIIRETLALYESSEGIEVEQRHLRVAPIAHGWYSAVRRLSMAVVHLTDAGFEYEAALLRRSLIEHVIALRWLVQGGDDAVASVLRAHQRWLERMQESAKPARWPVAEDPAFDVMLGIEPGASSQDRNLHFKHRCEEYGTDNVYSGWLVETNASHPSFSTATAYLQMQGPGKVDLPVM